MENKYFTPDIEDLCIGYELELLCVIEGNNEKEETWKNTIIYNLYVENKEEFIKSVRVPYLTKEQIEAEGWIDNTLCYQTPELFVGLQNSQTWRKLVYRFSNNMLQIVEVDDSYIYSGNCKDINTFRKIIKLLKI